MNIHIKIIKNMIIHILNSYYEKKDMKSKYETRMIHMSDRDK